VASKGERGNGEEIDSLTSGEKTGHALPAEMASAGEQLNRWLAGQQI
jgi:hypothetical protein